MQTQTRVENLEHARAIVSEAKGFGIEVGTPETDEELVTVANQIYDFALEAKDSGMNGEHITTIIKLTENYIPFEKNSTEETVPSGNDDDEDRSFYLKSIEERITDNIPVPPEIEGKAPNLPVDLNELSDKEIMRLHGAFTACSARINWLYAIEEAGESAARFIANKKTSDYIAFADKKDEDTKKPKTMEVLKAEARSESEEINYWRTLQEKHEVAAKKYHTVSEIFNNNVERLSRHWTMRTQERGQ
jgi:hypothetical protein